MGDELDEQLAVDVLAASLRLDGHDAHALLHSLAIRFELALPEHCEVERSKPWFSKPEVMAVTLKLGDYHYRVAKGHGTSVEAVRRHVVHGVVLQNQTLPIEEWTAAVATALAELAERNAHARKALTSFVRG